MPSLGCLIASTRTPKARGAGCAARRPSLSRPYLASGRPSGFNRRAGRLCVAVVAALLPLLAIERAASAGTTADAFAAKDPRSRVLLRRDCDTTLGHREITLFANGTLRLRDGPRGEERLLLAELPPDQTAALVRRLAEEDLSETVATEGGVEGDWVERCVLELEGEDGAPARYVFNRYDSLSLALSRVNAIAEELALTTDERAPRGNLPFGYRPVPGDVLERADGVRFEVVADPGDGAGVELRGVEQPLVLYLPKEDLAAHFVALVSRATGRQP